MNLEDRVARLIDPELWDEPANKTSHEWQDGYGRSYWQPMLASGERLWRESCYEDGLTLSSGWSRCGVGLGAVTYRSRARAERIARREQKRRDKKRLNEIREVQS